MQEEELPLRTRPVAVLMQTSSVYSSQEADGSGEKAVEQEVGEPAQQLPHTAQSFAIPSLVKHILSGHILQGAILPCIRHMSHKKCETHKRQCSSALIVPATPDFASKHKQDRDLVLETHLILQ